jgi:hypothetical protein
MKHLLLFLMIVQMLRATCLANQFMDNSLSTPACASCHGSCDTCSQANQCVTCPADKHFLSDASGLCGDCAANR